MRGLIVATLIAAGIPANPACAQASAAAATATTPEALAERFFGQLKNGNVSDALSVIGGTSRLLANQITSNPLMKTQVQASLDAYGPVITWERLASEPLGTLMRRDTYLVQYRDAVIRWRFVFMRLSTGWAFAQFAFEDQAQNWFD